MADEEDCTVDLQGSIGVDQHTSDITRKDETKNPCEESCVKRFLENDLNASEKVQSNAPFKSDEAVRNNSESLSEMNIPPSVSSVNETNKNIVEFKEEAFGNNISSCEKSLNEGPTKCEDLARKDETNNLCEESCGKSFLENDPNESEKRQSGIPFKFEEPVKNNSESQSEMKVSLLASFNATNKSTGIDESKEKAIGENNCEKSLEKCEELVVNGNSEFPSETQTLPSLIGFIDCNKYSEERSDLYDKTIEDEDVHERCESESLNIVTEKELQKQPSSKEGHIPKKKIMEAEFQNQPPNNESTPEELIMEAEFQNQPTNNESTPEELIMEAEFQNQPPNNESTPEELNEKQLRHKKRRKRQKLMKEKKKQQLKNEEDIFKEEYGDLGQDSAQAGKKLAVSRPTMIWKRRRRQFIREGSSSSSISGGIILNDNIVKGYRCTYCQRSLRTMQDVDEHISGLQHLKSLLRIQYEERKIELESKMKKDEEMKKSDAVVESIDNSTNHSSVTASLDSKLPLQESMAAENDNVIGENDEETKKQHINAEVGSVDNPNSSIPDCSDSKLSLQELLAAEKDTIVGLDYMTELQLPSGESKIHCSICGICTDVKNIKIHLFSTKHPINYLNAVNPKIINRIAAKGLKKYKRTREIMNACKSLKYQRGPGTIVVEKFDPSAPLKGKEKRKKKKQSVDAGTELTDNPTKHSSTTVSSRLANRSLQAFLSTANTVIVGLDYITEKQIPFQDPTYRCNLCNVFCCFDNIKDHVTGFRHRTNYLDAVDPEVNAKIITENPKPSIRNKKVVIACRKIRKKCGSGTITVEYCDSSTSGKEKKQVPVPESSSQKKDCMLYRLRHSFNPRIKGTSKKKQYKPTVRGHFNKVGNYPHKERQPREQTRKRQFNSDDYYPPLSRSHDAKRWCSESSKSWNRNEMSSSEYLPAAIVPDKEEFVMNVISSVTKRVLKDQLRNIAGLAKEVVKTSLKSGCIKQLLNNFPEKNNVREINRFSNASSVGFSHAERMTNYPQLDWKDSRNISHIRGVAEPQQAWDNTKDMMDERNRGNSRHIPPSRDVMMNQPHQDHNDRCDTYTRDMKDQRDWNNDRIGSSSGNMMNKPQYGWNNTEPIGDTIQQNWNNRSANIDSYNQSQFSSNEREISLLMRNTNASRPTYSNSDENWKESSHNAGMLTRITNDQDGPFNQFAASNIHQRTNSSTLYNQRNAEFSQIQSNPRYRDTDVDRLSNSDQFSNTLQNQSHFINRTGIPYDGPYAGSNFNSANYYGSSHQTYPKY